MKEKMLAAFCPEDYADPDATYLKVFRCLQTYIGIIRTSA